MKKRYCFVTLMVLAAIVSQLTGCGSPEDAVVATVGSYDITVKEFEDFTKKLNRPFPTPDEELDARLELLDSVIGNRLLIQAAYEKGIDQLEEINRVVLAKKDEFLLDVLARREISDRVNVSEAEIKDFYKALVRAGIRPASVIP